MIEMILMSSFLISINPGGISCDSDSDCYYVPPQVTTANETVAGLILLHCNGATATDLDTFRLIGDSLGWILATCHASRNHRDSYLNDEDIIKTISKLLKSYPVDANRIFLFGFSGQGVQALTTMLLHPELVRGVITVCAPQTAMNLAIPELLNDHFIYLISRSQDWNLMANYQMYLQFESWGVACTLVVTPGEHSAGSWKELLLGSQWLSRHK